MRGYLVGACVAMTHIVACSSSSSSSNSPATHSATGANLEIPSTPTHSVTDAQCQVEINAETAACGADGGVAEPLSACVHDSQTYDAEGCLPAYNAYLDCRAHATLDCSTGESTCETAPSYFVCQSQFVQKTGCTALGERTDTCAAGQYLYGCLNGTAPFTNCTSVTTGAAVPYFCCG